MANIKTSTLPLTTNPTGIKNNNAAGNTTGIVASKITSLRKLFSKKRYENNNSQTGNSSVSDKNTIGDCQDNRNTPLHSDLSILPSNPNIIASNQNNSLQTSLANPSNSQQSSALNSLSVSSDTPAKKYLPRKKVSLLKVFDNRVSKNNEVNSSSTSTSTCNSSSVTRCTDSTSSPSSTTNIVCIEKQSSGSSYFASNQSHCKHKYSHLTKKEQTPKSAPPCSSSSCSSLSPSTDSTSAATKFSPSFESAHSTNCQHPYKHLAEQNAELTPSFSSHLYKFFSTKMGANQSSGCGSQLRQLEMAIEKYEAELVEAEKRHREDQACIQALNSENSKLRSVLKMRNHQLDALNVESEIVNLANADGNQQNQLQQQQQRVKRHGVTGEKAAEKKSITNTAKNKSDENVSSDTELIVSHPKSEESRKLIASALNRNDFLCNLDPSQLEQIINCMYEKPVEADTLVIREGDEGLHLFVSEVGEFEVSQHGGKLLVTLQSPTCFGELALLYRCLRTATVKSKQKNKLWVLDRTVFQTIMIQTGRKKERDLVNFLQSVPVLKDLSEEKLMKLADVLELQVHYRNDCVIREGETANSFFLIRNGRVRVTQQDPVSGQEQAIRELNVGDYFGEKALISADDRRTATVYVHNDVDSAEFLCLYRKDFLNLVGDIAELRSRDYGDEDRRRSNELDISDIDVSTQKHPNHCKSQHHAQNTANHVAPSKSKFPKWKPGDLDMIVTLGLGGFGRVDLVKFKKAYLQSHQQNSAAALPSDLTGDSTFALKRMKKHHIVQTHQQQHVLCEKQILSQCNSAFIIRLFSTNRDDKYIYLLLEVCLGGELWTVLRDNTFFKDSITRFCLACVIEALDYLHNRLSVVYRDLKPENLLLDSNGYLKLCDFGFAKRIGRDHHRTYTFCGTPEYVAPELILNRGHTFSADLWSLGVLSFELSNGNPPFIAQDPMKIYTQVLKGVDSLNLKANPRISAKTCNLIESLCKLDPVKRLGYAKDGFEAIRSHKLFQGFDWKGICQLQLRSPFAPQINSPLDHSNFDSYPEDKDLPPDEISGWDLEFYP